MKTKTVRTALALAGCFTLGWIAHDLTGPPKQYRAEHPRSINRVESVSIPLEKAFADMQPNVNK
jgi:hypothetical protein